MVPTEDGPAFGKTVSHTSDIQFQHAVAPDNKSISILFDNFSAAVIPGGPPISTRLLSIVYPLTGVQTEMALRINLRGAVVLGAGTSSTFVFRALGLSCVLDPLLDSDDSNDYLKDFAIKIPAGTGDLHMSFFIAVEQATSPPGQGASLYVDSVDLAIEPWSDGE